MEPSIFKFCNLLPKQWLMDSDSMAFSLISCLELDIKFHYCIFRSYLD